MISSPVKRDCQRAVPFGDSHPLGGNMKKAIICFLFFFLLAGSAFAQVKFSGEAYVGI